MKGSMAALRQYCIKGESLQQELSKSLAYQMHYTNKNKIPQTLIHALEFEEGNEIVSEADNEIL